MRLLIDMNLSPRWCVFLMQAGIDAAHWSVLGANNAPDSEIMEYARTNNYIVLTHDLNFSAILAATHDEKPSVVQIRADVSSDAIGELRCGKWRRSFKKARCSPLIRIAHACACYHCEAEVESFTA